MEVNSSYDSYRLKHAAAAHKRKNILSKNYISLNKY